MRKLLCAMLVLALLAVPVLAISASATSIADEDAILSDLIPDSVDGNFEATDCDVKINDDGSMTISVTGASPALKIKLADGTLLYTGAPVNVSEDAYVAVDFGTTGNVQFEHMILHYTRKDKQAGGTFADLYLNSMAADDNYKDYRKQSSSDKYTAGTALTAGTNYYVVWDWGTYVASSDSKVFDDKMHQFVDIELNLTGSTVGSTVTFYTIAVVSDPEVELGTVTPEPEVSDDPSEDSSASEDETSDVSDETSDVSDETSETSDESSAAESSDESTPAASSDETPAESSAETSSEATPSNTSSTGTSSTAAPAGSSTPTESSDSEGGLGTGAIVGIIAAVVVVIGAVVGVVVAKKKK